MSVTFHQAKLENGLVIIGERDTNAHTTAGGFWVSTGARDERSELMGISHFLEHMMFKGTDKRTAEDVNRDFDSLGAVNNAYTSSEMTAYWAHVLPEKMDDTMEILADILRPSLREEDFSSEKQVILEEIAMYDDQPFWVLYEHAMERFYGSHPLAHRVLGTKKTVGEMTRDQLADYFSNRYASDNTIFAIAGAFDFDEVVDRISRECSNWVPTKPVRERRPRETVSNESDLTIPDLGQAYLVMLSEAPGVESDDRYAASLLSHTLGGDETSHLYWSLIETGLAEEAQCSYDPRDHAGEFATYAVCSHDALSEVEARIRKEISGFSDKLVQDDLDRARARTATAAVISAERPMGRVNRMASAWLRRGSYVPIEEEMRRIDAVTIEDLRACAEKYPLEPSVIARARSSD